MVRVERITKRELDKLSKLYTQLIGKKCDRERMASIFKIIDKDPNYCLLGVKYKNQLIGSAMAIVCYDLIGQGHPFMVIENVIIEEGYRGEGYGSRLLNKIEVMAKERNCYYIMLLSNKKRIDSHRFYLKHQYNCENNMGFKKYL